MNPRTELFDQLTLTKNLNDLINLLFDYSEENNKMVCSLCSLTFSCPDPHVKELMEGGQLLCLDEAGISSSQISSMGVGGVYLAQSVQAIIEYTYGVEQKSIPLTHDWLNILGLINKHLTDKE